MHFIRLRSETDPMFSTALSLYEKSFPAHEQRALSAQIALFQQDAYHFDLIYEETRFVGLLLYWEHPDFRYVEHFCIDPQVRNQHYGQTALMRFHEKGIPVRLEIDPPTDALSLRRQAFYGRLGYQINPFAHVHPPYHNTYEGHALVVLSYPALLTQPDYDAFARYLAETVMALPPEKAI